VVLQKPREIAARALLSHSEGRGFIEDVVDRELAGKKLSGADRSLVQEICYGVVRWRATLDWLIEQKAAQRQCSPAAQALLRLGLYQLFWLDRVPQHAAVNETVASARALELGSQAGFVNAMLRNYARAADETRARLVALKTSDPALGWSHPAWLVSRWQQQLSPTELQALLLWNNTPAAPYARVNTIKADAAEVIEAWREEGVVYDFGRWDWVPENLVFCLRQHPPLERLRSFQSGAYYIQDPSTLLAPRMLDPKPGDRILDLCAAPGGKTTYIAQLIDNDGVIVASEPDARRRKRLQENCERLGADVMAVGLPSPETKGPFDRILVDAPCSNTGVLRRRLDARWRLNPSELARAQTRQRDLLRYALDRLVPGGVLVYSTCSLEPEENDHVVDTILAERPGLECLSRRLLHPARDRVDGAFAAVLRVPKTG
jgi:16S rRNA (cytosine967-C5)-methyltransferase